MKTAVASSGLANRDKGSGFLPSLFEISARETAIDELHFATALYTTQSVVAGLLSRIQWPKGDCCLIDTSAGDGAFVNEAIRKLIAVEPSISEDRLCSLVEAWEIHPCAAGEARRRITETLEQHGWDSTSAERTSNRVVINADFLTGHVGRSFNCVVGNPPFLRYTHVPSLLREEYESALPAYAQNDLLHSFLARCVEVMKPTGELALVTSDRWLFNMGAAALREALGRYVGISHMERLDPSTTFYRPKVRKTGTPPRVHPVAIVLRRDDQGITLGRRPVYPDALGESGTHTRTLGDIARVSIAPWLGKDGVFVVDAAVARRFPPECIVPAVDTDDVKDDVVQAAHRFAIRTFPGQMPPDVIVEHLKNSLHRLSSTGKRRKDWWLPPETWHNDPLDKESLLIPRIATGLRFSRLPAGVLAINHNLTVVEASSNLADIEAILRSEKSQEWIRRRAPRLENGFYSITTTLLRQLPVD